MSRTDVCLDGIMTTPPVFTSRRKTAVRRAVIFLLYKCPSHSFPKNFGPRSPRIRSSALPPNAFLITPWLQFLGDQYGTFRMGSVPGVEAVLNFQWAHAWIWKYLTPILAKKTNKSQFWPVLTFLACILIKYYQKSILRSYSEKSHQGEPFSIGVGTGGGGRGGSCPSNFESGGQCPQL